MRTDEGLETSDHFSFHRLSLKYHPLSRLQDKKKIYCDSNAHLFCTESQNRKQVKQEKEDNKKKKTRLMKYRVNGTALPKKCCQSKKAEHCPTS